MQKIINSYKFNHKPSLIFSIPISLPHKILAALVNIVSFIGSYAKSLDGISIIVGITSSWPMIRFLTISAICWETKMIPTSSLSSNFLNAVSIYVWVVSLVTTMKFASPFLFLSPIPVNKKPVTVASSPMQAISKDPLILNALPFFDIFMIYLFKTYY